MKTADVRLVIPFYGKLPPYFNLYINSLRFVEGALDVLFVTDIEVPQENLPRNFEVLKVSFDEFRELVKRKVYDGVALDSIRKICDLKPFYGKIFEEQLREYGYWAYGDCDLIYGKTLIATLKEIVDGDFDVVSFREQWMSGGFSVVRNCERMNNLAFAADDWRGMLSNSDYCCFDECRVWYMFKQLRTGKVTIDDCRKIGGDSWTALLWRTHGIKIFRRDLICESNLRFSSVKVLDDGIITHRGTAVPIFHYIGVKTMPLFKYRELSFVQLSGGYSVDAAGFYLPHEFRTCVKLYSVLCYLFRSLKILVRRWQ